MELSRIFLLIVFVLLLFAGFASAQGPGPKTVVIAKEDNEKEIVVPEGAIFEVRLEHSGGTGYLWEIVEPDKTHLKVLKSTEVPLKEGRILGGPLLKTWKIKAVKVGQADLKVLLYRPWEGTEKAVDSLQVKIRIK
ncbi:MAG: protease inhibitor I42 family protein [Syntrophobacteraceae bacterium]|jgi:predicted secreted protein